MARRVFSAKRRPGPEAVDSQKGSKTSAARCSKDDEGVSLSGPTLPCTVDPEHLTRHERTKRAREHFHDARHLIDGGDAVERAGFNQTVLIDCARPHKSTGPRIAGRDAVHRDVVGPELIS